MSRMPLVTACALAACALAACGSTTKPLAGTVPPTATTAGRAKLDDPRPDHIKCLKEHGFQQAHKVGIADVYIEPGQDAPYVHYEPSPGAAQEKQIEGVEQGAEVIGSALLYPGAANETQLNTIEKCVAQNVLG